MAGNHLPGFEKNCNLSVKNERFPECVVLKGIGVHIKSGCKQGNAHGVHSFQPCKPIAMALVLIVDDNVINRILLNEIIEDLGYDYEEADCGKDALRMMEQTQYDAVLLDVEMPQMNGFEVVRHVRGKMPEPQNKIPIVAVTAHDPVAFQEEYDNSGFDELIVKPYSQEKIRQVFRSLGIS